MSPPVRPSPPHAQKLAPHQRASGLAGFRDLVQTCGGNIRRVLWWAFPARIFRGRGQAEFFQDERLVQRVGGQDGVLFHMVPGARGGFLESFPLGAGSFNQFQFLSTCGRVT